MPEQHIELDYYFVHGSFGSACYLFLGVRLMLAIPSSSWRGEGFFCFGLVRFGDRRIAVSTVKAMNGSNFGGRRLLVKEASFWWSQRIKPLMNLLSLNL